MRLIQIDDTQFINLDASTIIYNEPGRLVVWIGEAQRYFEGEQADALAEIITKNSTNLNDLVELRRREKEQRDVPDEVLLAGVK